MRANFAALSPFIQRAAKNIAPLALFTLAALGAWLLAYDMEWGPWAYSDSVEYLVSARSFLAGQGLGIPGPDGSFVPLTLHPPGYPLMLAPFMALGMDGFAAAALLNVLFFAGSIALLGWGTSKLMCSFTWGFCAALLTLISPALVKNFDGAMSEAPFIFLTLANIFLLAFYLRRPRRLLWVLAALCAALAGLVRIIGLVSVVLGLLALILVPAGQPAPLRRRLPTVIGYTIISALPSLAWLLSGLLSSGTVASRSLQTSAALPALNTFRKVVVELLVMWLPYQHRLPSWRLKSLVLFALAGLTLMLLAVAAWRAFRRPAGETTVDPDQRSGLILSTLALVYIIGYLAFLGLSFAFSSIQPDILERTLVPIQPLLFLTIIGAFILAFRALNLHPAVLIIPLALLALTFNAYRPVTWNHVRDRHATGSGYTSLQWRTSELLPAARQLPPGILLVSNEPAVVLLYTGEFPYGMSEVDLGRKLADFPSFGSAGFPEEKLFTEECGALILFDQHLVSQLDYVYDEETPQRIAALTAGLQLYQRTPDGGIYFPPGCSMPTIRQLIPSVVR